MTLRDYFAAKAIPELIAHRDRYRDAPIQHPPLSESDSKMVARLAYDIADAMLAERQKEAAA